MEKVQKFHDVKNKCGSDKTRVVRYQSVTAIRGVGYLNAETKLNVTNGVPNENTNLVHF